jgi:hypothetical protein
MYAGRELIFDLPREIQTFDPTALPRENQIVMPAPGDLCFGYFRPFEVHMQGPKKAPGDAFWDLMIFYGRNARLFGATGWVPSNLFATVVENLAGLAEMGARVYREGIKEVRIERLLD